jgi:hypothetical protein
MKFSLCSAYLAVDQKAKSPYTVICEVYSSMGILICLRCQRLTFSPYQGMRRRSTKENIFRMCPPGTSRGIHTEQRPMTCKKPLLGGTLDISTTLSVWRIVARRSPLPAIRQLSVNQNSNLLTLGSAGSDTALYVSGGVR